MRLGVHVRTSGKGLEGAARHAAEIGCETIQVFASNPNAWHSPDIKPEIVDDFRSSVEELGLDPVVIHTPYLLNLASPDPEIHEKSVSALIESLKRSEMLGARYVVTHIGSHKASGLEQGIQKVNEAVSMALDRIAGKTILLLENSAGSGDLVGSRFEHLRDILALLSGYRDRLGICLDTAHLWGAGYEISEPQSVEKTVEDFDMIVGISRLGVLHLNDTKVALGAHVDRHANIGTGNIGKKGFTAWVNHQALQHLSGIIETPPRDTGDNLRDIDVLKSLRK